MSNQLFGLFLQFQVNKSSKVMFKVMPTLLTLSSKVRFASILNACMVDHINVEGI